MTKVDLYDAPDCEDCEITSIRIGGQPGDIYIGPTCNADGTYRTAFYVSGAFLPANTAGYKVFVNNIEYPIAFNANVGFNQKVMGVTGLPSGVAGVDVRIELQPDCFFTAPDLYNAPTCPTNLTANSVQKSGFTVEDNFVNTYTRKKDRKEKELGELEGCAIIIQKFQPDGFFQWTDVAVFPDASEITFDTPTDLPPGLHRYRAVVQCGSASCSDISEEITIEVLNVDCGTFPWRGNK